jgi:DNA-binding CsgD family transcriptional regulator
MLRGAAFTRRGDAEQGLRILEEARHAAVDAHPTLRSEIALHCALAHYARREFAAAQLAAASVSCGSDIVFARAAEVQGWIAVARADYDTATERFSSALQRLDACRQRDPSLEANVLQALAFLAPDRLDWHTWGLIESRLLRLDWSAKTLAFPRYVLAICASMIQELEGRTLEALRSAAAAEHAAPTAAFRVLARCRRAAIFRAAGEVLAHRDHTATARAAFDRLDPRRLAGDEKHIPLALAEEVAHAGDIACARALMEVHRSREVDAPMMSLTGDVRLGAQIRLVEGQIAELAGERDRAHAAYVDALRAFRKIGFSRRAVITALRLATLTGQGYLYDYAVRATRVLAPSCWMRRALGDRERLYLHESSRALSNAQREILLLICEGKSNAEIAAIRNRSVNTIRNAIAAMFRLFGVDNRTALAAECYRRGICR